MPLLTLPPELRLEIYKHAVTEAKPICINNSWKPPTSIIEAIKADTIEIERIFFQNNIFTYHVSAHTFGGSKLGKPQLAGFLECIAALTEHQRECLRAVEILCFSKLDGLTTEQARDMLRQHLACEGIALRDDVLKFYGIEEAWQRLSLGRGVAPIQHAQGGHRSL